MEGDTIMHWCNFCRCYSSMSCYHPANNAAAAPNPGQQFTAVASGGYVAPHCARCDELQSKLDLVEKDRSRILTDWQTVTFRLDKARALLRRMHPFEISDAQLNYAIENEHVVEPEKHPLTPESAATVANAAVVERQNT